MTQQKLNSLMILHVHKDKTDSLNLDQVANKFVNRKETREHFLVNLMSNLYLCMYVASILYLFSI